MAPPAPRRTVASSNNKAEPMGNLIRVSSFSHSTVSTLSDRTPLAGNARKWTREASKLKQCAENTYTIDVLGETCAPMSQSLPVQSPTPHSLATGSWQSEFGGSSLLSRSKSEVGTVTSSASRDAIEAVLTDVGDVALATRRPGTKNLRKIV